MACIVPAFEAQLTVSRVIAGLRGAIEDAHVIGIDDGSTDGTRRVLAESADETLAFDRNRGKGAALRAGFAAALARDAECVLSIDADGQHDPAYAPALVAALDRADVVIGSRRRSGSDMPLRRRLSNRLSSAAISSAAGCDIGDTQSGYRAIRAAVLRVVAARGDRYEFETDFLIRAGRAGFRIACVPISTVYGS
ncbi:MAG: glycosyltransferase family 2 protein, partial [Gemmatimonadaceae bacterium]